MPITFEEVTAEVQADRPAPPEAAESQTSSDASANAATEQTLRALVLHAEREWRTRAD
ncbi:hypothetical protein [Hydrogenophaga sp.]|uniref:hypothetical protein n=1 Tax=Hydrogenophaga sp. TaxID=1904254 RepID=UPI00271F3666|nr:hypothetical protein [Hydrogenophaga sp.]MDO9437340.1 hypothetical protein [Hydrogenophaga sp.]